MKEKKKCTTFYLPREIAIKFKVKLAEEGLSASSLIERWIKDFIGWKDEKEK